METFLATFSSWAVCTIHSCLYGREYVSRLPPLLGAVSANKFDHEAVEVLAVLPTLDNKGFNSII